MFVSRCKPGKLYLAGGRSVDLIYGMALAVVTVDAFEALFDAGYSFEYCGENTDVDHQVSGKECCHVDFNASNGLFVRAGNLEK